ncbi:MAG: flavodoxin family protein [Spirochaetota bacterium]
MTILAINGSPRHSGNTSTILHSMIEGAQHSGAETEYIHLKKYHIEGCIGCEQCRRDKTCTQFYDGMHLLYPKIEEASGLILGSPTYNYNVTPWMKAFIDRLYPFFNFGKQRPGPYSSRLANRGKQALVFSVCEQEDPKDMGYTIASMRDACRSLGYSIAGEFGFTSHFSASSVSHDQEDRQRAFEAGKLLATSLGS